MSNQKLEVPKFFCPHDGRKLKIILDTDGDTILDLHCPKCKGSFYPLVTITLLERDNDE